MKFPLSWLQRYLETEKSAAELAAEMTRIGLEVEGLDNPAERLRPFVIAKVLSAAPHLKADRLQVLAVDRGDGKALQVVCGAPNARAGLVGVFASPGTHVPGLDVTLKVADIRGVQSNGMMCSARELQLGEDHSGIIELPEEAPVGQSYAAWAGLDDPVFDVAITPNRPDCMGVYGIARDLAAAGMGRFRPFALPSLAAAGAPLVPVRIEDSEGCPAFFARSIAGVRNGPSPAWLQALLEKAGLRPISALVDITNYFAIGYGRPLHVYDVAKVAGGLVARRARAGETLVALNGKSYALSEGMTVIADDRGVQDIAGIMGGEESGVADTTSDVLVEAAFFDPARTGATGRALGLASDARARFERGVDPAFVAPGLDLAVAMMVELCGGTPSEMAQAGAVPLKAKGIVFNPERTASIGGVVVPAEEQRAILQGLGFRIASGGAPFVVDVPTWRPDIDGEADLVEEIVRIKGLDQVQAVALPRAAGKDGVAAATLTAPQALVRRLKRVLAARGLDEAITWSFIPERDAAVFGAIHQRLRNPLSAELAVMRNSLLPGLVAAARRNRARGRVSIRLFEEGRRYLAEGERPTLAILLAGEAQGRDWRFGKARAFDAFDAKAEVLAVLVAAGVPVDRLQTAQPAAAHYHPGRSARLKLGKNVLAEFGELHPDVAADVGGAAGGAVAAEIFLDALPERRQHRARPAYVPSPLQAISRDFAFVVPEGLAAEQLVHAVRAAERGLVADVRVFDRFAGAGIAPGMASLALTVTIQPQEKTLADANIEAIARAIVAAAAKLGATLRG